MIRQLIVGAGIALGVAAALGYTKYLQISAAIAASAGMKMPPDTVTSILVKEEDWPIEIEAVGTLAPVNGAMLSNEDMGRVLKVRFEPGSHVEAGAVLVELDTSVERAELQAAEARLQMMSTELGRAKALRGKNANSQSDLDTAEANQRTAFADMSRYKAVIARKTITAPFAGRTGVRLVNEGEVIQPGTPVVSLQALDRLFLNFSVPQRVIHTLAPGTKVKFRTDAGGDRTFEAVISSVDPQIDERTRNGKVQAIFENTGEILRPGMFVSLTVVQPGQERVLSMPASGVAFAPYGDTVFVIEDLKDPAGATYRGLRQQVVKLGRRRGDMIAVLSGLTAGQEVVSSGVFKLRPGSAVNVDNAVTPSSETTPNPADT